MLTSTQVRAAMLAKLADSALDAKVAKTLQFSACTANESVPLKLPAVGPGFIIPYFTLDGKPSKFFRYRYLTETRKGFSLLTDSKPLKYGQTAGTLNEVYIPPLFKWKQHLEGSGPVIITEGELKAACATLMGLPTLGLGGVWCFMSKKSELSFLPQLEKINWKERIVVICYDSDAVTNPDVLRAESLLAKQLVMRGAVVRIARIPPAGDAKVGLDDYLVAHGADKFKSQVLGSAFEYRASAALHEMSTKVVYIQNPGMVYSYERNMMIAPAAFTLHAYAADQYEEYYIDGHGAEKVRILQTATQWLKWPKRSELKGVTFAPGKEKITESKLNLWDGWEIKPVKGDVTPWHKLMDHLFGSSKEERRYFEQWCAYPLQNPGYKMAVAAVLWGVVHGSGKTLAGHTLMRIYGKNSTEIKDSDLEDARFEWAENKQFVLGDDITGHDNRKLSRRFMTMITQKMMRLNPKYIPSYSVPDCINYYFTSNDPDAFFMDDGDRRFFIWEVLAGKLDVDLRKQFIDWRDSDSGIAALFHYFLTLDLTGFDPQAEAMVTQAKKDMQLISKSDLGSWVAKLRENPDAVIGTKLKGDLFTAEELHLLYDPLGTKRASANALSRELKRAGFRRPVTNSPLKTKQGTRRVFAIRNPDLWADGKKRTWLQACQHYDDNHGIVVEKKEKY